MSGNSMMVWGALACGAMGLGLGGCATETVQSSRLPILHDSSEDASCDNPDEVCTLSYPSQCFFVCPDDTIDEDDCNAEVAVSSRDGEYHVGAAEDEGLVGCSTPPGPGEGEGGCDDLLASGIRRSDDGMDAPAIAVSCGGEEPSCAEPVEICTLSYPPTCFLGCEGSEPGGCGEEVEAIFREGDTDVSHCISGEEGGGESSPPSPACRCPGGEGERCGGEGEPAPLCDATPAPGEGEGSSGSAGAR